jgi:hypothetical protein
MNSADRAYTATTYVWRAKTPPESARHGTFSSYFRDALGSAYDVACLLVSRPQACGMFFVMMLNHRGLNYVGARLASVAMTLRKSNRPC